MYVRIRTYSYFTIASSQNRIISNPSDFSIIIRFNFVVFDEAKDKIKGKKKHSTDATFRNCGLGLPTP